MAAYSRNYSALLSTCYKDLADEEKQQVADLQALASAINEFFGWSPSDDEFIVTDHIVPVAREKEHLKNFPNFKVHSPENLQLLCRVHNATKNAQYDGTPQNLNWNNNKEYTAVDDIILTMNEIIKAKAA
jgi:hypothetical protein